MRDRDPKPLDPNMVTFLQEHPMARMTVYRMMVNAATTRDDPKMVAWYAPVENASSKEEAKRISARLCGLKV